MLQRLTDFPREVSDLVMSVRHSDKRGTWKFFGEKKSGDLQILGRARREEYAGEGVVISYIILWEYL